MDRFQSRLFRYLFDTRFLVIVYVDSDSRIFDANDQVSQLGYSRNMIHGIEFSKLVPEGEESLPRLIRTLHEKGGDAHWEGKLKHSSGSPMDFIGSFTSLPHPSGRQLVVGFLSDISPLKSLQRRLFALHYSAVEIGKASTPDTVYDLCMDIILEVLGWENRSVAVLDGDTIIYARDERPEPKTLLRYPASGKSITARTFSTGRTQLANDVSRDPDFLGSPLGVTEIKALLMVPINLGRSTVASINIGATRSGAFSEEDVALLETLAQHAASALERIEKNREEEQALAARTEEALSNAEKVIQMARHDLKGPLQAILASTYMLRNSQREAKEHLESIETSVKFARDIIDDLRQKAVAADLDYAVTDISDLLEKAIEDAHAPRGVRIEASVQPRFISLDPAKMRRVFYNVLKNAVEALGEEGVIRVSSSSTADSLTVTVEDNGRGIPEVDLPFVFNYGYTTKKGGSGLGLFFGKEMVEAHGGKIEVSSKKGSGTTVRVTLPYKPVTRLQDSKPA